MQFRPLTLPFGDAVASLRRSDPPHTDVQTFQFAPESKAALVALIRTIALENKDRRISANTVLPGTMDAPANRAADPKADPLQRVQPPRLAGSDAQPRLWDLLQRSDRPTGVVYRRPGSVLESRRGLLLPSAEAVEALEAAQFFPLWTTGAPSQERPGKLPR